MENDEKKVKPVEEQKQEEEKKHFILKIQDSNLGSKTKLGGK